MPAKKIDPEEQIHLDKKRVVKNKLLFAVGFAMLVVMTNFVMTRKADMRKAQAVKEKPSSEVMGEATQAEKERLARVQKQTSDVVEMVTSESNNFIEESKEQVETTFSDIVYKTTIKPLIDRIQKLPDDQQDYVREALCK